MKRHLAPMTGMIDQFSPHNDEGSSPPRGRWILVAVLLLVVAVVSAGGWYLLRPPAPDVPALAESGLPSLVPTITDSLAKAPDGVRITVRVLNATDTRGLARRATQMLRELGYDVVDFDGTGKERRTRSAVISHTGHADWARRLQRAMNVPSVDVSDDSSRFVDFTVLLGSDWKPPTQTLRP